jgi:fibronectin-binding autotransporter adhesin
MAFPTIPTGGRVVTGVQANTTSPRTSPNLSGLTNNSGDLMIAICVGYQSSSAAGSIWSGWTAGWTEFADLGGSSNTAVGAAYKWSTGSETGTVSVTQAGITGHAVWILLSIPGAHASTPPAVGAIANGTAAAANPAALDPAGWGTEETLWVSLAVGGETATTGSFTGITTGAPTNYVNEAITAISGDVVGGVNAGVAFRQLSAASEDVGPWTGVDLSNARNSALLIAVRPSGDLTTTAAIAGTATTTATGVVGRSTTASLSGTGALTATGSVDTGGGGGPTEGYIAYGFDEGTGTTTANQGTTGPDATNVPGWDTGKSGTGYALSRSTTGTGATFDIPTSLGTTWTVMGWFKVRSTGAWAELVQGAGISFYLEVNGLVLDFYGGNTIDGPTLTADTWYHIAVVGVGASGTRLVVNGAQYTAGAQGGDIVESSTLAAATYYIGGGPDGGFQGEIDDFRIIASALSDAQITEYMNAPVGSGGGGPTNYDGSASLTGTASATATGSVTAAPGSATLTGTGSIAATGTVGKVGSATLSGAGTISASPILPPFATSVSGRNILDQTGTPYFMSMYHLWNLICWGGGRNETGVGTTTPHSTFEAVATELEANGINTILVLAIGSDQGGEVGPYTDGRTWDGVAPWSGGIGTLNETYWARVDDMIDVMAAHGITVFLNLISSYTIQTGTAFAGITNGQGTTFGTAIGNRYKNKPNIVWQYGVDYFDNIPSQLAAVQAAITAAGDTHLFTVEFMAESSTTVTSGNVSPGTPPSGWSFSDVYTYNAAALEVRRAWGSTTKPIVYANGHYYQGNSTAEHHLMSDLLGWSFTSGSKAFFVGSESTWQSNTGYLTSIGTDDWPNNEYPLVLDALTSLPGWEGLVPDTGSTFVTSSRGTDATAITSGGSGGTYDTADPQNNYLTAAVRADGKLGVLYTPVSRTGITIDTSKIVSNYKVYWVDPHDGSVTTTSVAGSYSTPGNNSNGTGNWYLVFEENSAITGTASVAGTGTVTASGTVARSAGATRSGTGAISASGTVARASGAAVAGSGALGSSGTRGVSAGSTVAGTGSIAAAGVTAAATGASITGTGALTAAGTVGTAGSNVTLTGTGAITASGTIARTTGASRTGTGAVSTTGVVGAVAGASVAGTGSINASGVTARTGTASVAGVGAVTASGTVTATGAGNVSLIGTGAITTSGTVARSTGASVAGTGAITTTGVVARSTGASRTGTGALTSTGFVGKVANASIAGVGTLTTTGAVSSGNGATLAGTGTIGASGFVARATGAALSGAGAISASGTVVVAGSANATISGVGTITSSGSVMRSAGATRTGTGTLTTSGTVGNASVTAAVTGTGVVVAAGNMAAVAASAIAGYGGISATGYLGTVGEPTSDPSVDVGARPGRVRTSPYAGTVRVARGRGTVIVEDS